MLKRILTSIVLINTLFLISCQEKSDIKFDEETFTKIYDNSKFSTAYYPIDIQQTSDGGFIILSESKLSDSTARFTFLMKVDKYGKPVKSLDLDPLYVSPVGQFININDSYYFFCMEGNSTRLAKVSSDLENVEITPVDNLTYPAAASYDGNSFTLLNYDYDNRQFVISLVSLTGVAQNSTRFNIEDADEIEGPIINHFLHTGKQFPFQVGRIPGGLYYFNGFYDYTLSLVFTSLSEDNAPEGVVYGQHDDGGISAILPLGGNKFAASRFNFGDNYFVPNATITTSGISQSAKDNALKGNPFPELVPDAKVKIIKATIGTKKLLIYGSDTRSNQIGLYFYDELTGEFLGSRYLGFLNPFELANLIQTADGGLAVCGTSYLAGRFPRICLFKLSKEDVAANVKN